MGLRPIEVSAAEGQFLASWVLKLQNTFILPNWEILQVRSYAAWKTLVWAAPGLLIVAFIVKPESAIQRLLLVAMLVAFAFYLFFPYDQGHGWGYRYIHPAWGLIPLVGGMFAATGNPSARSLVATAVCAGILATPIFLYTTRNSIADAIAQQPPMPGKDRAAVFITLRANKYTPDLVRNYPEDKGRKIIMWSDGQQGDSDLLKTIAPEAILYASDDRGSTWTLRPARDSQERIRE